MEKIVKGFAAEISESFSSTYKTMSKSPGCRLSGPPFMPQLVKLI
jgi:hypothetical protein